MAGRPSEFSPGRLVLLLFELLRIRGPNVQVPRSWATRAMNVRSLIPSFPASFRSPPRSTRATDLATEYLLWLQFKGRQTSGKADKVVGHNSSYNQFCLSVFLGTEIYCFLHSLAVLNRDPRSWRTAVHVRHPCSDSLCYSSPMVRFHFKRIGISMLYSMCITQLLCRP